MVAFVLCPVALLVAQSESQVFLNHQVLLFHRHRTLEYLALWKSDWNDETLALEPGSKQSQSGNGQGR